MICSRCTAAVAGCRHRSTSVEGVTIPTISNYAPSATRIARLHHAAAPAFPKACAPALLAPFISAPFCLLKSAVSVAE